MKILQGSDKDHGMSSVLELLHKLSEWKLLLPLITAYVLYFCYEYFKTFCNRLSIPYIGMDFPRVFFIQSGYLVSLLIILSLLVMFLISVITNLVKSVKIGLRLKLFISLIILIILFIVSTMLFNNNLSFIVWAIFVFFLSLFLDIQSTKYTNFFIIFVLFVSYSFFFNIPEQMGNDLAEELVEGSSNSGMLVDIQWDSTEPEIIKNKTLILVMSYNNKYYVVEKDMHFRDGEHAKLYIIPDNKVKFVASKT